MDKGFSKFWYKKSSVFVQKYSLESMSESVIEELLDETSASASVSHAHLLPLVGVCLLPHQAVVVTEYMPRGSLRDLQRNSTNPLTYTRTHSICAILSQSFFHRIFNRDLIGLEMDIVP